jgi:hypothetical protein
MASEKICLHWTEFQENIRFSYKEARSTGEYSDVTLATEDGHQVPAHRVILSASSGRLRDLLSAGPPSNPVLLPGLTGSELVSVVDFIYYGEVEVQKENLYDFLAICKKLELKGLTEMPEHPADKDKAQGAQAGNGQKPTSKESRGESSHLKRPWDKGRTVRNAYKSNWESMIDKTEDTWSCNVCGKIASDAKSKANLKRHTESHVSGGPWPCNICSKVSSSRSGHLQHRRKYHKDQKEIMKEELRPDVPDASVINSMIEKHGDLWVCKRCGKTAQKAIGRATLQRHVEVHIEGLAYTCDVCGKSSGSKNGLSQHKYKHHRDPLMLDENNSSLAISPDIISP